MTGRESTVRLHRILPAPADRVYKAFTDPDALTRWLPPYGFLAKMHEFTAEVGGGYRMSFQNFSTGSEHVFSAKFLVLEPNKRIRHADRFEDPNLPGEMEVEINLREATCGTELTIVQVRIPEAIPVEMCDLGWQESLEQLARLVGPEIPDGPG